MKPKHILTLSVLAGLLAVVLAQVQLRSARGETIVLFRATETVTAGQALGLRVETVTLPGDKLFPNLLKEAPTAEMVDYVTSTPLRDTVHAGQIILYRHLESMADPGLRALIPAGKKAISIDVDSASAVAFLIEPKDRVDVLAALPEPADGESSTQDLASLQPLLDLGSSSPELASLQQLFTQQSGQGGGFLSALTGPDQAEEMRTQVLLEGVEVLAVGRRYRRAEASAAGASYDTVTLLVSAQGATKIAHARDVLGSPMTLVLRSPEEENEESSRDHE